MSTSDKKHLVDFLKSKKLLVISTVDGKGNPWTCNVYFSVDKDLNLFFVSPTDTKHSQHIANHPKISFSIPWFDEKNLGNRKAVQGIGTCKKVTNASQILRLLKNHYKYYPLWKTVITYKAMREKLIESRPYVIAPTYMKYWDDELFGEEGVREFNL